ncbi:MAG: hypothetical protein MUO24_04965 [Desulfobacterales bacterium]|nr:hypothetical protein [Desulfobacterales bacterium]
MKRFKLLASIVGVLVFFVVAFHGYAGEKGNVKGTAVDEESKKFIEAGLKPFEPKLLWEKKFKEQISQVDLAKDSGEIVVSTKASDKDMTNSIYLLDKNRRVLWKQGHIEKIHRPWNGHISDDGQTITYDMIDFTTYFTVVFYVDRNNKERWHKAYPGASYLSPDGTWVVLVPSGGTGNAVVILNDKGEVVLRKEYYWAGNAYVRFSENSKYVAIMEHRTVYDQNIYWIFDRNGKLVLEFKKENGNGVNAFATSGLISIKTLIGGDISTINGENIIHGNGTSISGNGKRAIRVEASEVATKIEIIEMPSLKKVKSYNLSIPFYPGSPALRISFEGRYIMLGPDETTSREIFVLDTAKDAFWKTKLIVPSEEIVIKLSPYCQFSQGVFFTKDEKYMVVHVINENVEHALRYYQLH